MWFPVPQQYFGTYNIVIEHHGEKNMKLIKQLTGLCLCAAMLAGCTSSAAVSATASAEASAGSKKDPDVAAIILFTNDVHGRIINDTDEPSWGYARIAKEKQDLVEAGYDTYLFSAGDDTQGEPIVNQDEGASAIKYMTETGYDLMEAGNHEFDWGSDNLLKTKKMPDSRSLRQTLQGHQMEHFCWMPIISSPLPAE